MSQQLNLKTDQKPRNFAASTEKFFYPAKGAVNQIDRLIRPIDGALFVRLFKLVYSLFCIFPMRAGIGLVMGILLSIVELLGLTALLPLLALFNVGSEGATSGLTVYIENLFIFFSIPFELSSVLVITFGLGVAVAIMRSVSSIYFSYIAGTVRTEVVAFIVLAMQEARWSVLEREGRHALFSAIQVESAFVGRAVSGGILAVSNIISLGLFVVMAAVVSWETTVMIVLAGTVLGAMLYPLIKYTNEIGREIASTNRNIKQGISEFLSSQKLIRSMGVDDIADKYIHKLTSKFANHNVLLSAVPISISAIMEVIMLFGVLLSVYCMVVIWEEPVAEIILLLAMFSRLTPRVIATQNALTQMIGNLPSFVILSETKQRLCESVKGEYRGTKNISCLNSSIKVEDLWLSLGNNKILNGLSLEIYANQLTAIVGESGGGKSTLLDAILGLRTPQSGRILVDGEPLSKIDIKKWRNSLSIVPQDQSFFRATLRENFLIYAPVVSDEDIWCALKEASAEKFIRERGEGLDIVLGDDALNLSGGQRQRLSIARALLRKPSVLLLDEPTSALDRISEAEVFSTIHKLKKSYTIIVVTHRLDILKEADAVYSIVGGRCVEN